MTSLSDLLTTLDVTVPNIPQTPEELFPDKVKPLEDIDDALREREPGGPPSDDMISKTAHIMASISHLWEYLNGHYGPIVGVRPTPGYPGAAQVLDFTKRPAGPMAPEKTLKDQVSKTLGGLEKLDEFLNMQHGPTPLTREDVSSLISHYRRQILPALINAAGVLDGAIFDGEQFCTAQYHDTDYSNVRTFKVNTGRLHGILPSSGRLYIDNLMRLTLDSDFFSSHVNQRKKYQFQQRADNEKRALLPLAHVIAKSYHPNMEGELVKIVQKIRMLEFGDAITSEKILEYIDSHDQGKALGFQLPHAIHTIQTNTEDENAVSNYLEVFTQKGFRKKERAEKLFDDAFLRAWTQAYNNDWGEHFAQALSSIESCLTKYQVLDLLATQESGALVALLQHAPSRRHIVSGKLRNASFPLLSQLYSTNQAVYEHLIEADTTIHDHMIRGVLFIQEADISKITKIPISDNVANYLRNIRSSPPQQQHAHIQALEHIDTICDAIGFDMTPFSDISDTAVVANWLMDNPNIIQDVHDMNAVCAYMGDTESLTVRKHLASLKKKNTISFLEKYMLQPSKTMPTFAYARLCELYDGIDTPKEIARKRDLAQGAAYMATSADTAAWNEFKSAITAAEAQEYEGILRSHRAIKGAHGKKVADALGGSHVIADAYATTAKTQFQPMMDRLLDVAGSINQASLEGICSHVVAGNYQVATLLVEQAELGLADKHLGAIAEFYTSDQDLADVDPEEVGITLVQPIEIKEMATSARIEQPTYNRAPFEDFVRDHGFDPDIIEAIVYRGFKVNSGGNFIGQVYMPLNNVRKNIRPVIHQSIIDTQFLSAVDWLEKMGVIIKKGGMKTKNHCVSLTSHVGDLDIPAMRDHMRYLSNCALENQ